MSAIILNNGVTIPQIGYRHIDTAAGLAAVETLETFDIPTR